VVWPERNASRRGQGCTLIRFAAEIFLPIGEESVIPALDPATGLLPLGRHRCSESEVEAAFVSAAEFATSPTRPEIWRDWEAALQLLRAAVTVHAAWLGGSFTTAKIDPEDLDVTFLVNGEDFRGRSPQDRQIVALFTYGSRVKTVLGIKLDTYLIPWECIPQPQPGADGVQDQYFWARGHWDDWWQRQRLTPKGTPPTPADALPRRGYLEVSLSDYP
jgi:hypothetical protein